MSYANAIRIQVVNNKFPTSGRTSACCSVSVPFSDFIFPILYFIFPISYFLFHISYCIIYYIVYYIVPLSYEYYLGIVRLNIQKLFSVGLPHTYGREGKGREGKGWKSKSKCKSNSKIVEMENVQMFHRCSFSG
jgi:hypothetical protein